VRSGRRALLALLAGALVPESVLAAASPARVVYIATPDDDGLWMLPALAERGYVEGANFRFIVRPVDSDGFDEVARRTIAEKPAVLLVGGVVRVQKLMKMTSTIPIVLLLGSDPVGAGLAKSLARPGYNVTGFSIETRAIAPITISLLRAIRPTLKRIVVVLPMGPTTMFRFGLSAFAEAAAAVGVSWEHRVATNAAELKGLFANVDPAEVAAFLSGKQAGLTYAEVTEIFNARRILTMAGLNPDWVEAGALMCYIRVIPEKDRHVAAVIDKLLRGIDAGSIPFETGDRDEFTINRTTAKKIGVAIPQEVLLRATRVID
jgi:putative ABC transport system substrate-binding protein